MVWKCPSCPFTSRSYQTMQKHYYAKHYKSKAKTVQNKGKDKKKHLYKPTLKRKR